MSDWGYLGDDDWQNPAVLTGLNFLDTDEGVLIGDADPKKKKVVKARAQTQGEKATATNIQKQKVAEDIRNMATKTPNIIPAAKKEEMLKAAFKNPLKFATMAAKPLMQQVTNNAVNTAKMAIKMQHNVANQAAKNVVDTLKKGVASGVLTPAVALALQKQKFAEIKEQTKVADQKVKDDAKAKVADAKNAKVNAFANIIKKRGQALDKKSQSVEAEIRKVAAQKLPAKTKDFLMKTLKGRLETIKKAKSADTKLSQVARLRAMGEKGIIPKGRVEALQKKMVAQIKAEKQKGMATAKKTANAEKSAAKLYVLGKWIQAYESAISYAKSVNANTVTIPLGAIGKQAKVGARPVNEVKMSLKSAEMKLEKFRMAYAKLEKEIAGKVTKKVPPAVVAVTPKGQTVTPEMIKGQTQFIRQQMAKGAIHPVRGSQAIAMLNKVETLIKNGKAPALTGKKQPTVKVVINIAPQALTGIRAGERAVATKAGTAKTKAMTPKPGIPSAIPHATAKTPGTVVSTVNKIAPVPKVVPGVSASKIAPNSMPRAASPDSPQRKPVVSVSPFKRMSLDEFREMFAPPFKR